MDVLKFVPGSYTEMYPASSHDGNQVLNIKDEVTDIQEEEDPLLITFPGTMVEHKVSCMYVCPLLAHLTNIHNSYCFSNLHLPVCPHEQLHSDKWILKSLLKNVSRKFNFVAYL
jgi:hypothetical protein